MNFGLRGQRLQYPPSFSIVWQQSAFPEGASPNTIAGQGARGFILVVFWPDRTQSLI